MSQPLDHLTEEARAIDADLRTVRVASLRLEALLDQIAAACHDADAAITAAEEAGHAATV